MPAMWIPFALAAASAAANYQGQRKVDGANDKAFSQFMKEQQRQDADSEASVARTRALYEQQPDVQQVKAAELAAQYKGAQGVVAPPVTPQIAAGPTSLGGGGDVVENFATALDQKSKRYNDGMADALGGMRSFDEGMMEAGWGAQDNAIDLRQIGADRRGSQRVLGARQLAAQGEGKAWGTAGDALSLAAMVTSMGAMSAPAGAAGTAANASAAALPSSMAMSTPAVGMATEAARMAAPHIQMTSAINGPNWLQRMQQMFAGTQMPKAGYGS